MFLTIFSTAWSLFYALVFKFATHVSHDLRASIQTSFKLPRMTLNWSPIAEQHKLRETRFESNLKCSDTRVCRHTEHKLRKHIEYFTRMCSVLCMFRQLQNSLDRHEIEIQKLKRQHANITRREKALREQHEMFSRSSPSQYGTPNFGETPSSVSNAGRDSASGFLLSKYKDFSDPIALKFKTGASLSDCHLLSDDLPSKDSSVSKPAADGPTRNEKMSRS